MLTSPQVWSNHSARFGALHVCTSTVSSHSLQRTAQHQWNLHSHLVMRVTRVVSYPRPQHITSQPSVPRDILLQTRPAVPREPGEGSESRSAACSPSIVFKCFLHPPPRSCWQLGIGHGDLRYVCLSSGEISSFLSQHVPQRGAAAWHRRPGTGCGGEVAEPLPALARARLAASLARDAALGPSAWPRPAAGACARGSPEHMGTGTVPGGALGQRVPPEPGSAAGKAGNTPSARAKGSLTGARAAFPTEPPRLLRTPHPGMFQPGKPLTSSAGAEQP